MSDNKIPFGDTPATSFDQLLQLQVQAEILRELQAKNAKDGKVPPQVKIVYVEKEIRNAGYKAFLIAMLVSSAINGLLLGLYVDAANNPDHTQTSTAIGNAILFGLANAAATLCLAMVVLYATQRETVKPPPPKQS
jgi:hypothetical protein